MSAKPLPLARTQRDFRLGAVEVFALCGHNDHAIIHVKSDLGHIVDILVTPTGQLRVMINGLDAGATKGRR